MTHRLFTLTLAALIVSSVRVGPVSLQGQTPQRASRSSQHFDEAALAKPAHRVRIDNDVRVRMRDGVTLSVDAVIPTSDRATE